MTPLDLLDIDASLSDEERQIRTVVRRLVTDRVRPHVAGWYEDGQVPAGNWPASSASSACSACT